MPSSSEAATSGDKSKTAGDSPPRAPVMDKSRERFSRRTTLWIVLVGVLVITPFAAWAFQLDYISGQVGVLAAVSAVALYFSAQLVRYRLRISLRTLLIIMAVIAVGLGLVGRRLAESRRETNAVEQLKSLGARITFKTNRVATGEGKDEYFETESGWYLPSWVQNLMGESFFSGVDDILLTHSKAENRHVPLLAEIRGATSLNLAHSRITAQGVAELPVIPGVTSIDLDWSQVSAESIARLREFPALEFLRIEFPAARSPAPPVARLELLAVLEQVKSINVAVDVIDAKGIAAVAAMPNLGNFLLHTVGVPTPILGSDASGLAELAHSRSLRYLSVSFPAFSAAELESLQAMPSLRYLVIRRSVMRGAPLDEKAIKAFEEARPDVELHVR